MTTFNISDKVYICPKPGCHSWDRKDGNDLQKTPPLFGNEIGTILDIREEIHPISNESFGINYLVEGLSKTFWVSSNCLSTPSNTGD